MQQSMSLYSFYLSDTIEREDVERALDLKLTRGIEATWFAVTDEGLIAYTQFHVLTMIGYGYRQTAEVLDRLGFATDETFSTMKHQQDYPIEIDPNLGKAYSIESERIVLNLYRQIDLLIIAHVISQSVALGLFEQKLSDYYERSRALIDRVNTFSMFKRSRLATFAKQLVLVRHDMLIDLYLLDKPDILWDNEDAEMLYNTLAFALDLKERFEVVEYKLNNIKDDIVMVMDLTNHNHSSFLEWIIIVLIAVEIVMGVMEWMGLKH